MFDQTKQFDLKILSGGEKVCTVTYPSDAEWCDRARKQKTVRRFIGRDKSTIDSIGSERADFELLQKIRVDKEGPDFDEAEASRVIARLERTDIVAIDREGATYRVEMKVPGAEVTHELRMPTAGDAMEYQRSSVKVTDSRKVREFKVALEPSARMYDKLLITKTGYAGDVPVNHKAAAVVAVMAEFEADSELEDDDSE